MSNSYVPRAFSDKTTCRGKEFRCRFFKGDSVLLIANDDTINFQLHDLLTINGEGCYRVGSIITSRYGAEIHVYESMPEISTL